MTHRIAYLPLARDDLEGIYDWIADRSDEDIAYGYILRLQAAIDRLADYPERGTPRDDLAPGLRTIAFERKAVIAYRVEGDFVRIVRVVHRGRDLSVAFDEGWSG